MYSVVTVVNDTILYSWKLLRHILKISAQEKKEIVTEHGDEWIYGGEHFTTFTNIELLCCRPETNMVLYVNGISKKVKVLWNQKKQSETAQVDEKKAFLSLQSNHCNSSK